MEALRQYLISIVAAAVLCSVVASFANGKGTLAATTKLITGVIMSLCVIAPLLKGNILDMTVFTDDFSTAAQAAASVGKRSADIELSSIIKAETQAYILDKAASLGAQLDVQVYVTEQVPPVPCAVQITGAASPFTQAAINNYITQTLGIQEESISWR